MGSTGTRATTRPRRVGSAPASHSPAQHDHLVVVASVLYALADLAVARGQHDRALRLVGASEALRDRVGEPPPPEMEMVGDVREPPARFLDRPTAANAYQQGRAMALSDAVAYASRSALKGRASRRIVLRPSTTFSTCSSKGTPSSRRPCRAGRAAPAGRSPCPSSSWRPTRTSTSSRCGSAGRSATAMTKPVISSQA